jgi:hypothetical protein
MTGERQYTIGKGKPPQHTRFKKGQSGNPMGRRKESKSLATLLWKALNERVTVTENGKRRTITKVQAMFKQLANKAASGDLRVAKQVFLLAATMDLGGERKSRAELEAEAAKYLDLFRGGYQILADLGVPMPQTQSRTQVDADSSASRPNQTDEKGE